jgi:hypothetical protein
MCLKLDLLLKSKLNPNSILESKPKSKPFNLFLKNQNMSVIPENQTKIGSNLWNENQNWV